MGAADAIGQSNTMRLSRALTAIKILHGTIMTAPKYGESIARSPPGLLEIAAKHTFDHDSCIDCKIVVAFCVWRVDGVTTMSKRIFALCAATALGFAAILLTPAEGTASKSGIHSFHGGLIKFFRPIRHHHHGFKNWNNRNNGLYAGYGYPGYYYMPSYSTDPIGDVTGSVSVDPIIPPPPGLNCKRTRDVVTVPSAIDGTARQITITRC